MLNFVIVRLRSWSISKFKSQWKELGTRSKHQNQNTPIQKLYYSIGYQKLGTQDLSQNSCSMLFNVFSHFLPQIIHPSLSLTLEQNSSISFHYWNGEKKQNFSQGLHPDIKLIYSIFQFWKVICKENDIRFCKADLNLLSLPC